MVSELFLDLIFFEGKEKVLEFYEKTPLLEKAALKRAFSYDSCPLDNVRNIRKIDEDLIICFFSKVNSIRTLKKCLVDISYNKSYMFICENKYNFHRICGWLEGKGILTPSEISLSTFKRAGFTEKVELYSVFQDVFRPTYVGEISDFDTSSYLISRSGRINGKRTLRKCLSVLLEIILVKKLKLKSVCPGYVLIGLNK